MTKIDITAEIPFRVAICEDGGPRRFEQVYAPDAAAAEATVRESLGLTPEKQKLGKTRNPKSEIRNK